VLRALPTGRFPLPGITADILVGKFALTKSSNGLATILTTHH